MAGTLRAEDLRRYSEEYYHQVAAFPTYLSALHSRLSDGELRRTVLRNLSEEEIEGAPHSELWLDFAEGMGAQRETVREATPSASTKELVGTFRSIAAERAPLAALAAFYAYESQVARIAGLWKAQGLEGKYGADAKTYSYFTLHSTWDVHHFRVWGLNRLTAAWMRAKRLPMKSWRRGSRGESDVERLDGIQQQCSCN